MLTTQFKVTMGVIFFIAAIAAVIFNQFTLQREINTLSGKMISKPAVVMVTPSATPTATPTATLHFVPAKVSGFPTVTGGAK